MSSLFCRHNRFTADCPICSKGTLLDPNRRSRPGRSSSAAPKAAPARTGATPKRRTSAPSGPAGPYAGPYVSAGPYERDDGSRFEIRLERVPGGIRLAEWTRGQLARRAPELRATDLPALVLAARERGVLPDRDLALLEDALAATPEPGAAPRPYGASPGRAGDMQDELRVEATGAGTLRVARWLLRPGTGWILSDAPTLFPAKRYADAVAAAARAGVLT